MRLRPKLSIDPKLLKNHKIHILRFHAILYTLYLGMGAIEHLGLNIICGTYALLGGVTIVCHVVVEEL